MHTKQKTQDSDDTGKPKIQKRSKRTSVPKMQNKKPKIPITPATPTTPAVSRCKQIQTQVFPKYIKIQAAMILAIPRYNRSKRTSIQSIAPTSHCTRRPKIQTDPDAQAFPRWQQHSWTTSCTHSSTHTLNGSQAEDQTGIQASTKTQDPYCITQQSQYCRKLISTLPISMHTMADKPQAMQADPNAKAFPRCNTKKQDSHAGNPKMQNRSKRTSVPKAPSIQNTTKQDSHCISRPKMQADPNAQAFPRYEQDHQNPITPALLR